MLRPIALLCALAAVSPAQDALAPHSAFEPPAAKEAASLTASTKASPPELLTTGEKSEWNETAPYAEAVEIAHRLERASRWVKVLDMGTTPEGRTMIALVVSKDRAFTPEAAAKTGKVVIMIQSGIHSGEIEGKDTVLMLVRDMAVTKRFAWLDHAIFVAIPVFNVDGHENFSPYHRAQQNGPRSTGLRATAQRLNLNRDYIKADTPEMRGWLRLFNAWMPDFLVDNHVTDGADFQYDVTWDMARNQDLADPAGAWVRERFVPELDKRMAADGHLVAPYGGLRPGAGGAPEFFTDVFSPRYSHLYAAAQNRPSLLVETHSLKAAKTRAWANYDIMRHSFDTILLDPEALRRAVREADREMASRAGDRAAAPVYLAGQASRTKSRPLVYHGLKTGQHQSAVTGAMTNQYLPEPNDLATVIHDQIDTTLAAQMPLGYLIPPAWKQVADLLALHGVVMERTGKPLEQEFETYRFSGIKFADRSVEGHVAVSFEAKLVQEKIAIPAGAWWVPLHQRRARLILSMLEPQAPDSLATWGLLNAVFEGGGRGGVGEYLAEPIARRMMADSPELRKEFEEKLAADAKFAADRNARLEWWYQRSKYLPGDAGRYPIVRVWEKTW